MKKIGICGHYGGHYTFNDGQTVKTKTITEELINRFGKNEIDIVDTFEWRKNPIRLLFKVVNLFRSAKNIIVLPSHNGVKVFIPLFVFVNIFFNHNIHYIVIGGWLSELVEKKPIMMWFLKKFNHIYIETLTNVKTLNDKGLKNIKLLPNYKKVGILAEESLITNHRIPFKLCTFSRVTKEKGIEDAINAVIKLNNKYDRCIFTLDIYGPVDNSFDSEFKELIIKTPDYISYKGIVDYNSSVSIVSKYFCLIFPTRHTTEGLPGTIIDSFSAGVPVIASRWESVSDYVDESTGYTFEIAQIEALEQILDRISKTPEEVICKKVNCLRKAKEIQKQASLDELFCAIAKGEVNDVVN